MLYKNIKEFLFFEHNENEICLFLSKVSTKDLSEIEAFLETLSNDEKYDFFYDPNLLDSPEAILINKLYSEIFKY